MTDYRIVPLDPSADRKSFRSASEPLNRYFHTQVTQDIKRRISACFTAVALDGSIAGYYTLASASVPLDNLPEHIGKKLPRYPSIPAVLLGRLAVDGTHAGRGLGGILLADALIRSARAEIAVFAMIVEAKDAHATAFYRHFGFLPFPDRHDRLFYPLGNLKSR
ncbi:MULTISPECIES: GNAT family N-acetyltransferase [unclassified Neisseria]|uniref:GNAT family N-acetyltransferase n=1 Tax=unclassified Neisseria TaxID=2623750 RepID=UPI00266629C0|nr:MULTISPECIES: GNAT family N-acetyltransferase [unclassified Neisseria]MDO1509534.1 GNAT family N-acetyltransferase [Neisseria sp. MVDL19-042950]MDO1515694.1 GNAT family N-acetyltransferase [Neisseria sp. MVDL18-041461]MDO1563482.1 GNAT family N-acetyltransferase [Neisseria sp. MVDL20-010259]